MCPILDMDFVQDHKPSWIGMVMPSLAGRKLFFSKKGRSAMVLFHLVLRALLCLIKSKLCPCDMVH